MFAGSGPVVSCPQSLGRFPRRRCPRWLRTPPSRSGWHPPGKSYPLERGPQTDIGGTQSGLGCLERSRASRLHLGTHPNASTPGTHLLPLPTVAHSLGRAGWPHSREK